MNFAELTEKEFKKEITKMDPAHRVLARIERAKQLMQAEQKAKETEKWSGSQSSSASLF